jgi:superfamily I DNA and/or RNA helicase
MRDAAVIGATVTKVYLSAKDLPAFDVVVVDEASMVILPALYFASGLAREKVVVSGDFRQLPPIVSTEQKAVLDEIGRDVFHAVGVVVAVDANKTHPRFVMLEEQFRMHTAICGLISGFMYKGKLHTSTSVGDTTKVRDPLSGPLTIIDTSSLWPFETQTANFSRYNLVHALVVRNLSRQLHEAGHIKANGDLGICTPYAAQAKLIRRLIEDSDNLKDVVDVGTVHRYQGDEKTAIIIDLPYSVGGGRFIGRFLQGDHPDDDGAKLLNVAVSRAKENLVIVANLTYLDDRLPSSAFLRDILFRIQTSGQVLDAREILSLQPADLRGLGRPVDIDLETQRTGLFKQKDFETVFRTDVSQAKGSVVIFSGFVTPERIGSYGDLFRSSTG